VEEALHGEVKLNCDTCQYRLAAMEHIDHHQTITTMRTTT